MADPSIVRFTVTQTADPQLEWTLLGSLTWRERLDEPYELVCEIGSDQEVDPELLVGHDLCVDLERGDLRRRCCGVVARVDKQMAEAGALEVCRTRARVHVVPALALLGQTRRSRIFQDVDVVAILTTVLGGGLAAYGRELDTSALEGEYPTREYCVQLLESDLAFAERLMQEEGISYRFEHSGDTERLVLSDANAAFGAVPHRGPDAIPFIRGEGRVVGDGPEPIHALVLTTASTATSAVAWDYDWTHPRAGVAADAGGEDDRGRDRQEYGFGAVTLHRYADGAGYGASDVDSRARRARERQELARVRARGAGRVIGFAPGTWFEASGHDDLPELDAEYVLVGVTHSWEGARGEYVNTFECIPRGVRWLPPSVRAKPSPLTAQVATVVGPAGEEIHTDAHGRIKVQLDWDREGALDEHSSMWVRVLQPWAGAGWGHVFIPRIGMEVVVESMNGDVDRPFVTGCLYDGDHALPYSLPDEKTKSTLKSNSTLGGGGSNELRLEDAAGAEQIYHHAQKDMNEVVENDHDTTVGTDQSNVVGVDQDETIGSNQSLDVGANRSVHVGAAFDETIDGGETRTVSGGVSETISGGETRTISGGLTETISGGETRTVTGALSETVSATHTLTVGAALTETIGGSLTQTVAGGVSITTPGAYTIVAAAGVHLTATGGSTIVAAGGNTVVAPGGHTSVDFSYGREGGFQFDAYGVKEDSFSKNNAYEAIRLAVGIAKVDLVGLKVGITGGTFKETNSSKVINAGIAVISFGANLIKSKLIDIG